MITTEERISSITRRFNADRSNLIQILQEVKKEESQISSSAMQIIASNLGMEPAEVYSVVTFYPFLGEQKQGRYTIRLCRTLSCHMKDKDGIAEQLSNELGISFGQTTSDGLFSLEWTGCLGACDQGPALLVNDNLYTHLSVGSVKQIIHKYRELAAEKEKSPHDQPGKVITPGYINLQSFPNYEPWKGIKSLIRKSPVEIAHDLSLSDGIFTSELKSLLDEAKKGKAEFKYIVCNSDESGPGSFKDRFLLSNYADLMIEGMLICGYISGASKGIIYLRGQYADLQNHLHRVLVDCRQKNYLGHEVFGLAGFNFDIEIRMGAGGYIGKNDGALINVLNGQRTEPAVISRAHFITTIEDFIRVSCSSEKGKKTQNQISKPSFSSKVFSVSGDCTRPGIYELPLGISITSLLEIVGGKNANGVLLGGVTGKYIAAEDFELPVMQESVNTGATVVVIGPDRNMIEIAKNLLEFFIEESCGQCTPCREGVPKLLEGLKSRQISTSRYYLLDLCELSECIKLTSKCNIGRSAPDIFLSVMKKKRSTQS
ncbi:MAG: hypothetical protein GYA15_05355 [Leptolinea sp.]|jgi:[NiFe] hydrogenase diaphorase moiety large subunit|nr:hypothetical protein [Leptolinea sp.]